MNILTHKFTANTIEVKFDTIPMQDGDIVMLATRYIIDKQIPFVIDINASLFRKKKVVILKGTETEIEL